LKNLGTVSVDGIGSLDSPNPIFKCSIKSKKHKKPSIPNALDISADKFRPWQGSPSPRLRRNIFGHIWQRRGPHNWCEGKNIYIYMYVLWFYKTVFVGELSHFFGFH
jgi:hypothetical protein